MTTNNNDTMWEVPRTAPPSLRLSRRTQRILRNFVDVFPYMWFEPGDELRSYAPPSICPDLNVLAVAKITETIPKSFLITALSKLIKKIGTFREPIITLHDTKLALQEGNWSTTHGYASEWWRRNI
jgi:hypothetical protein